MSTYKITTLSGVTLDGTSKFTASKFLNSADAEIQLPSAAGTLATESYVTNALNTKDYENDVAHDNLVQVVDRLITYMQNWINVGNLNMSDVRSVADSGKILPSTSGSSYAAPTNPSN